MRNESSNTLFYSGILQGADAVERKLSFYFEALQNRTILQVSEESHLLSFL